MAPSTRHGGCGTRTVSRETEEHRRIQTARGKESISLLCAHQTAELQTKRSEWTGIEKEETTLECVYRLVSPTADSQHRGGETTGDLEKLRHPTNQPGLVDINETKNKQIAEHPFLKCM